MRDFRAAAYTDLARSSCSSRWSLDALAAQAAFYLGIELYSAISDEGAVALGFSRNLAVMALTLPLGHCLLDVYRMDGQAPIERRAFGNPSHVSAAGRTPVR